MARLVDDRGAIMTGGAAQVGKVLYTAERRSCTSCRARITSVPGLKIRKISDRSVTDLERITSSPGVPFRACSSGTVINSSTAEAESPIERVWISTLGGANSGKTSTAEFLNRVKPKIISVAARKTTK